MTRNLLRSAVAAALFAPLAAQAGVYGIMDGIVEYNDDGTNESWSVDNDKLRFGFNGAEDLGNGMSAFYQYEWAQDNGGALSPTAAGPTAESNDGAQRTRRAYVGLKGDWGSLVIGRDFWPGYGAVWSANDSFDNHATDKNNSNLGVGGLGANRSGDLVHYTTPGMSGFSATFAALITGEYANEDGIDAWELSAKYANGPLSLAATYNNSQHGNAAGDDEVIDTCVATVAATAGTCVVTIEGDDATDNDIDTWGIRGTYSFGDFKVDANYGNSDAGDGKEVDVFSIGAEATFDTNQVTVVYRNNDPDVGAETDDWAVNVRHFMSKTTRVFAEFRNIEKDGADDVSQFSFGVRHDWQL